MKTFLKILGGLAALVVIALMIVMFMTKGMDEAADKFFTAVKAGNYDEAYTHLSDDFKSSTSKDALKAYLEKNALTDYRDATWSSRSVNGNRGELSGSITNQSGGAVPVTLSFVSNDKNEWKIYAIGKPAAGITEESSDSKTGTVPAEKELAALTNETMLIFAQSVRDHSMAKMYAHSSQLWQKQFTVEKFDEAFGSFFKFGDALMVLDQYAPQFTEKAAIDENGVLTVKGLYPTSPSKVYFEHQYIYEGTGWKLVSLDVNVK